MANRIDWDRIRIRYVTGDMGLRELSDDENVSLRALSARSHSERWPDQRIRYRDERATEVQRETQRLQVGEQVAALTMVKDAMRSTLTRYLRLIEVNSIDPTPGDAVNAAKLLLLLEGEMPAESVDLHIRSALGGRLPSEMSDAELESAAVAAAEQIIRERGAAAGGDPEGTRPT